MKFQKLTIWIILAALVIIMGAAFVGLNFRVANSTTDMSRSQDKYAYAKEDQEIALPRRVNVFVESDDPLGERLQRALVDQLREDTSFAVVGSLDSLDEVGDDPVLVVRFLERSWLWTPFYGQGSLRLEVAYASNGDLSWREDDVVEMPSSGVPESGVVWLKGEYNIHDSSWGVISRIAYRQRLAERSAGGIEQGIVEPLFNQP